MNEQIQLRNQFEKEVQEKYYLYRNPDMIETGYEKPIKYINHKYTAWLESKLLKSSIINKQLIKNAFNDGRVWNNSWDGESYYKELSSPLTKYLKDKP